jgi:4'-phosphopantetheinyl transferase
MLRQLKQVIALEKREHDSSWSQASPVAPALRANHIDVWSLGLDDRADVESEARVLSSDEMERAHRLVFARDRIRFIRCRSTLRELLAKYLGTTASDIRFEYLACGKPQMASGQSQPVLQFSVSHSASMALIAVGSQCQLGVDIEKIRWDVDTSDLAGRFFSARERASLQALPDHLRVPGFFACWTRKEAFLKATGDGLTFPLEEFSVTTHPDLDPGIEEIRGNAEAGRQWFLADIHVFEGYRATIAVRNAIPPPAS